LEKYILDNNILLDILLLNRDRKAASIKAVHYCLINKCGYIAASSIHSIIYIVSRQNAILLAETWALLQKLNVCKTPSYIDYNHKLAKSDIEDYLIYLSAEAIGAKILTSDKDFLNNCDLTISIDDFQAIIDSNFDSFKSIPFLSLRQLNKPFESVFEKAYDEVIKSGWYILGNQVKKFEINYAKFNKTQYCIGVGNGLDALVLSLKALQIGEGDEVIVPSNTYIATWLAVSYVGATIVPVEPHIDTYNINADLIESKISPKTKAIMPVNLYGQAAELDKIEAIAKKHKLFVIEDNAQAQGATCNAKLTGTYGHINATSFYPGKNLGALGDAGAITTQNSELAQKVEVLRNYGSPKKYFNAVKGYNSRLDEMQAAFLSVKLADLDTDNNKRIQVAGWYTEALQNIWDLILPKLAEKCTSVYHLYIVRTKRRNELQDYLTQNKIGTVIHYPIPPHLQEAYSDLGYKKGDFPLAEEIAETCLSLPIWPNMQKNEVLIVCKSIKLFFDGE